MHIGFTSHLWLKSASCVSSHPCMRTCVLRCDCFLLACLVFYLVSLFYFQSFLMSTSAFNERFRSNPLCNFRLGTVVTSDYETPLTRSTLVRGSLTLARTASRSLYALRRASGADVWNSSRTSATPLGIGSGGSPPMGFVRRSVPANQWPRTARRHRAACVCGLRVCGSARWHMTESRRTP